MDPDSLERADQDGEKDSHLHVDEPRLDSHDLKCVEERLPVWSNTKGFYM